VTDSEAHRALREDPALGALVADHGELALTPAEDTFRRLVVSIVNQQLSVESAAAIRERLAARFDITPAAMLAADEESLRETGLSGQKVRYVRNVAAAYREREYPDALADLDDDAVIDELTDITGVGTWTAKMYLVFCLGRPDVFPVEDLGIRHGMQSVFGTDTTRAEMETIAERWQPYRSYAALHLWRHYEG
jgi:DNA-3-methyladenine glycosylase II